MNNEKATGDKKNLHSSQLLSYLLHIKRDLALDLCILEEEG